MYNQRKGGVMIKKQLAALWIIFFMFTLMTVSYVILTNEARLDSWTGQYMKISGISWKEMSKDSAYLAEYQAYTLTKRFALLSFLILNLGMLTVYVLRKKDVNDKLGFEEVLKGILILAGAGWIIYWLYQFSQASNEKIAWLLSPINLMPILGLLVLIGIVLVVVQSEIGAAGKE